MRPPLTPNHLRILKKGELSPFWAHWCGSVSVTTRASAERRQTQLGLAATHEGWYEHPNAVAMNDVWIIVPGLAPLSANEYGEVAP